MNARLDRTRPAEDITVALTTELDAAQSQRILAEACLRNLRGDVECIAGDRVSQRFSTRMLEFRDKVLLVECPTEKGIDKPPTPGTEMEIYFRVDDLRYSVTGRLDRPVRYALSAAARVSALRIERIRAVHVKQRRNFYRLSVLGLGDVPVYMNFTEEETPPGPAVMVEGIILNVSAGGLAVRCDMKESVPLARVEEILVRFFLPDMQESFAWLCRIVHERKVLRSDSRVFGLEFAESRNDRSSNREAERIHQFVIGQQRKKIHRRR